MALFWGGGLTTGSPLRFEALLTLTRAEKTAKQNLTKI